LATAVKVLDKHRVEARARVLDVAALLLLGAIVVSLAVIFYRLGWDAARATSFDPSRDKWFVLVLIEGAVGALAFGWVGYRLFAAAGRRVGG